MPPKVTLRVCWRLAGPDDPSRVQHAVEVATNARDLAASIGLALGGIPGFGPDPLPVEIEFVFMVQS
jgi:hypothetical protein